MKCCLTCVFIVHPGGDTTSFRCGYPIPEYIKICIGGWISSPEYQGRFCDTYNSRSDVVAACVQPVTKEGE